MYTYPRIESTTWSGNEAVAYGTGIGSVGVPDREDTLGCVSGCELLDYRQAKLDFTLSEGVRV